MSEVCKRPVRGVSEVCQRCVRGVSEVCHISFLSW